MTSVKTIQTGKPTYNKQVMRNTYVPDQEMTTAEQQVLLRTGANKCSGFNFFNRPQPSP